MSIMVRRNRVEIGGNLSCANVIANIKNIVSIDTWVRMPVVGIGRILRAGLTLGNIQSILDNGMAVLSSGNFVDEPIKTKRMSCKVDNNYGTVKIGPSEIADYIKSGKLSLEYTSGMMDGSVIISESDMNEFSRRSILDEIYRIKLVFDVEKIKEYL